jgi:hypothetical protein
MSLKLVLLAILLLVGHEPPTEAHNISNSAHGSAQFYL